MFIVKVYDPPANALSRPLQFRLGPFARREVAEAMAIRAVATQVGATVEVIEIEGVTRGTA